MHSHNDIISDIKYLLHRLYEDVNASYLLFMDMDGHVIVEIGLSEQASFRKEVISLLSKNISLLMDVGKLLNTDTDHSESDFYMVYHESPKQHLFSANICTHYMLTLIVQRGTPFSSRIGTIWYYVRQTAADMVQHLKHISPDKLSPAPNIIAGRQEVNESIDALFE